MQSCPSSHQWMTLWICCSKEEILDFLNPFSDGLTDQERNAQRLQEIDQEIAEEQPRIDRSFAGENEYVGSETLYTRFKYSYRKTSTRKDQNLKKMNLLVLRQNQKPTQKKLLQ